jgi:hypothetical protein
MSLRVSCLLCARACVDLLALVHWCERSAVRVCLSLSVSHVAANSLVASTQGGTPGLARPCASPERPHASPAAFFFLSATYRVWVVVGEGHVTGSGGSRRSVRGRVILKLGQLSPLKHFEERPDIQGPAPCPCVHARRSGSRLKFSLAVSVLPTPYKQQFQPSERLRLSPTSPSRLRAKGAKAYTATCPRRWLCVPSYFQRLSAQMSGSRECSKRSQQIRQTLKAALPRHNCTNPLSA